MKSTMSRWGWLALVSFALAIAGCGEKMEPGSDAGADAAARADSGPPDAGPIGPVQPIFDPAALEGNAPFFDFPYPSELRVDADGTPQLDDFPRSRGLVAQVIGQLQEEHAGFSPITGVYFRFTGPLLESALPSDPAAQMEDESLIVLVDIDADSPERGRHLPAYVRFQRDHTAYWPDDTLVVRAVPGVHMHPGRRYAVVIRNGLLAADGEPVQPSPEFAAVSDAGGALGEAYTALFADLADVGIAAEDVLVASAFTVSDRASEMDLAREFIQAQELPTLGPWMRVLVRPSEQRFEAEMDVYELFQDDPPYTTFGTGRIVFGPDGQPTKVTRRTIRVALTVPTTPQPENGYPVVLYGHGTGGDARTHYGEEGTQAAVAGVAMLGFDAALHGLRAPPGVDVESLIVSNPVIAREVVRQTVIDMMLLYRMLAAGSFDVPADVADGTPIALAPSPVLYMGHSQGSQEGGLLLGVEPTVQSAFLSEGGGGAIISIVERDFMTAPIACTIAPIVGETCQDLGVDHPLLTLLVQPLLDPADPLNYAHRFLRERPADWAPLDIAMTEGTVDMDTPPHTIEALAAAIGLPLVEPVVQESDPLRIAGLAHATAPISDNLMLPSGAEITGGLMQWEGENHFVIYHLDDAMHRYVEFLRTAAAGDATIVGPP